MVSLLTWEQAIDRFQIGKVFHESKIDDFTPTIAHMARSWLKARNYSLFISGEPGSGKTHLSVALLKALIAMNCFQWIIYTRSDDLDDELLQAVKSGQESYVLEKYREVPILFLDDLGVERVNDRILKQYYSIIDRRLNNLLPTVFTSNILRKDIGKNLGDRIASRLQMATEIIFPHKDFRKGFNT